MNWPDLPSFLAMGGYGRWVWSALAVVAAVLLAESLALRRRAARLADAEAGK